MPIDLLDFKPFVVKGKGDSKCAISSIVLKEQLFDLANQKFILNLSFRGFAFQMRLKAVVKP